MDYTIRLHPDSIDRLREESHRFGQYTAARLVTSEINAASQDFLCHYLYSQI